MMPDHFVKAETYGNISMPSVEQESFPDTSAPRPNTGPPLRAVELCGRLELAARLPVSGRAADRCPRDLLLLMEHDPVFTAGRMSNC